MLKKKIKDYFKNYCLYETPCMYNICIRIRITRVIQRRCIYCNIMYASNVVRVRQDGNGFFCSLKSPPSRSVILLFRPLTRSSTHNNVITRPANSNNGDVGHMVLVMESCVCDYTIWRASSIKLKKPIYYSFLRMLSDRPSTVFWDLIL